MKNIFKTVSLGFYLRSPFLRFSVSPSHSSKSGQALAEFVIGLIAVLVLAACLRVGSAMITAHSEAIATARNNAAAEASLGVSTLSDAKYIHEVTAGNDRKQYTKDDSSTPAIASEFNNIIVGETAVAGTDWDLLDQIPDNPLSTLHSSMAPCGYFGLVKGNETRTVPINEVPAVRLFYNAKSIEVECKVWMTRINDIY